MIKLYQYAPSGNCYKVRLLLAHLGIPYQRVEVDLVRGEARTPEWRAAHPLGRVPVVVLDDGTELAESNAILWWFAEGSPYLPEDRRARAQVLQWLFWEQYDHEPYVAVARAWLKFFGLPEGKTEKDLAERQERGRKALAVMDRWLAEHPWFAANAYTIADLALYAYTHTAEDGGIALAPFPHVVAWCGRVRAQPRHVTIDQ
jgi:glutathione S-transferase